MLTRLLDFVEDAIIVTDAGFVVTTWSKGAEALYGWSAEEVLGEDVRVGVRLQMTDAERGRMRRATAATGRARRDVVALRKDGSPVDVELINVAILDRNGRVTGYLGIHRDISERKRRELERETRARQQASVAELGLRALAGEDVQTLMDDAVATIAEGLDVPLVGIAALLPGGDELVLIAGVGWSEGAVGTGRGPGGPESLVGYTVAAGEPVISEDVTTDGRFGVSEVLRAQAPVSALSVVVAGRHEPFGALCAFARRHRSFSDDDVNFVQAVANTLAAAVERADADAMVINVRELERARIARGLHDEALADLNRALALTAERGARPAPAGGDDELVAALRRAGRQLRAAVYDLRLGGDEDQLFPTAIQALVETHRTVSPNCEIVLELGEGVPTGALGPRGIEVLRVLGEALTNARRHAGAGRIVVRVWGTDHRVSAEVCDDGRGGIPPVPGAWTGGYGIAAMRARAELLDGRLDIHSTPDRGTTVRLETALAAPPRPVARSVRILLVEDHAAVREAIAAMLDREPGFEVVGQAASMTEARRLLDDVDVAVIDLTLPDGDGGDLIGELHQASPRAQALVLSATLEHSKIARAVERGAAGVLNKAAHLQDVADAVLRLRAGETLMPMDELVELLEFAGREREREHDDRERIAQLTPREREVLQALADGLDSRQIAESLHITIRTERNHIANILAKLDVHSQVQALLFALRYDVVTTPLPPA